MINQLLILLLCWYFKVLNSFLRYSKIVLIGILLVYQRYGVFINLGLQRDLQSCFIILSVLEMNGDCFRGESYGIGR